jgi:hypothetical protein
VEKFLQFLLIGLVAGAALGGLLSLVSGNIYVIIGVATLGTIVGVVLGIVRRKES